MAIKNVKRINLKSASLKAGYRNFDFCNLYFTFKKGITLIEGMIYIALLGGISVLMINFAVYTLGVYQRAWAERELVENGRLLVDTLKGSISEAEDIYVPTSVFNLDVGQLSLVTATSSAHLSEFTDFWVDNGRFMQRKEGSGELAISSPGIEVAKFRVERITQTFNRESVRITLQLDSNRKFPSSITLTTASVLRGGY